VFEEAVVRFTKPQGSFLRDQCFGRACRPS